MPVYGKRPDDVVIDAAGNAQTGATITLHATEADATAGANALATATTSAGRWTATVSQSPVWVRTPNGSVYLIEDFSAKADKTYVDTQIGGLSSTFGRRFTNPAALLADTSSAMGAGTSYLAGQFTYQEASSSASDHHVTTAGGVKLYVLPINGMVHLAAFGVDSSTPSVTGQLLKAATVAKRIVLPPTTLNVQSKPVLDADLVGSYGGSTINFLMTSGEGLEMAAGRGIYGVKFTSPYTGPASAADAVDATAGGKYDYGSRSVRLNAYCHVEDYEHENATQGIIVGGVFCTGKRINIHDIRHYKGWGAAIHRADGNASYGRWEQIQITDCDRGTETEAGASYNLTEDVTYTRVGPKGYTGQPGFYEVYTFIADAHSHSGEGACVGNVYRNLRIIDCYGGITSVRSSGTSDSDMPRDNVWENVTIEGRQSVNGYESVYIQGHNNKVTGLKMRAGSGVTAKMRVLFADGGGTNNSVEIEEASGYALPLVQVGASNGTTDNCARVRRVTAAPTTGSGFLVDVYGPRTQLDLSIGAVTGTSGYVRFNSPAVSSKIRSFDYLVDTAETFAQVVQVVGAKHVQVRGLEGYNYATVPPKDVGTSGGVTHLSVRGNNIDRPGGISIDLGGATTNCVVQGNELGDGKVNNAGTNNIVDQHGDLDFESTVGTDPGVAATVLAGSSINLVTANQAAVMRRRAHRRLAISKLRWSVGTSSGNYDIAVLDSSGKVLWAKGSTPVPATGMVEESFSAVNIPKGSEYFVAIVFDNTTATMKGITVGSTAMTASLVGRAPVLQVPSSFPFPAAGSSVTLGSTALARVPLITIHEA